MTRSSTSNQETPILIIDDPFPQSPRPRFTIGRVMVAIAVVAALLSLPVQLSVIIIAFSIPCVAVGVAPLLVDRRRLRLAAYAFWGMAIPINCLTALSCITPNSNLLLPIFLGLLVVGIPWIAALGTAWAILFARQRSVSPRTRDGAGMAVFFLAILPIVTLWTFWPLHLAFLIVRPTMEHLADQIAAGNTVAAPRRVGVFVVSAAFADPFAGSVVLLTDPSPNWGARFVRSGPNSAPGQLSPFGKSKLNVQLGGGWSYQHGN